ncbi:MAG: 30S ribosomal protein S13 [Clostridiales bacterium]|jgi:small subunit ribosomal protein S13|nr:30S ribosomal protein S13 [Clostridiales bacterium]
MRIVGVDLPNNKGIGYALTSIFGIGINTARDILLSLNIQPNIKTQDLSEEYVSKIRSEVEKYKVEGDLRRETALNKKRLMEIGCYRGLRHRKGLPVRGQRTKTNARTRKGSKKIIANNKKAN